MFRRLQASLWLFGDLLVLQAPIATEVEAVNNFCEAEDYHQQYLVRGGRFGRPQSANKGCTDPIRCYG